MKQTSKKKINTLLVQTKLKEAQLRLFSVLDFQRILGIENYGSARSNISRYLKSGLIQRASKGLYFLADNPPSNFELANKLYQPSYISFETALSFYGIIPETIYGITSATSRPPREYIVKNIKFSYKKIKKSCFNGYHSIKIQNIPVFIAEPEKALADYLYLVALGKRKLTYERIDLSKIKKNRLLIYAQQFQRHKLSEIINNLYAQPKHNQTVIY